MFIRSKVSNKVNSDHQSYQVFHCDQSWKVVGPVLNQDPSSVHILTSSIVSTFLLPKTWIQIKTEVRWRSSDQLFHLRSKLSIQFIYSTFLFADIFVPLLFALLLPFTYNLSAATSFLSVPCVFFCHLKAIWMTLCLNFRRHTNENSLRDSRLPVLSQGVRVQEKKERKQK